MLFFSFFFFTKVDQMSRVGSRGRHPKCRPNIDFFLFPQANETISSTSPNANVESEEVEDEDDESVTSFPPPLSSSNKSEVIVVGADTTIVNEKTPLGDFDTEEIHTTNKSSPDMSHVSVVVVGGDNDAIHVMDSSLEINGNNGGGLATSSSSPSSSSHGSMEQRYKKDLINNNVTFEILTLLFLFFL